MGRLIFQVAFFCTYLCGMSGKGYLCCRNIEYGGLWSMI